MMEGEVGILNVGAGDTKLIFDPNNPQDMIRAARIVKDMLRRGYALLVAVPGQNDSMGRPIYRRATDFDENTFEYIIADGPDPYIVAEEIKNEEAAKADQETAEPAAAPMEPVARTSRRTRIKATSTRSVAVARTAGG